MPINTDAISARYREQSIDLSAGLLLVTNFHNTEQEEDFTQ
jgi:hypothetical protein